MEENNSSVIKNENISQPPHDLIKNEKKMRRRIKKQKTYIILWFVTLFFLQLVPPLPILMIADDLPNTPRFLLPYVGTISFIATILMVAIPIILIFNPLHQLISIRYNKKLLPKELLKKAKCWAILSLISILVAPIIIGTVFGIRNNVKKENHPNVPCVPSESPNGC